MKLLDRFLYPRTVAVMARCDQRIAEARALLEQMEPLPNMVPFSDLRPGQAIEHDRDWWVIVVKRSDGAMLLRREGDSHEEWLTGLHRDAPWNVGAPF